MLGGCEPGYACAYQNTLSWRTPTTPMPMLTNPRVVFERLLGGVARTPEERRALAEAQASILDSLLQETRRLRRRLGGADRLRLDGYLAGIRELEERIAKLEQQGDLALSPADLPAGIPDSFDEHVKLMFDLQVLAYQADLSRVTTFLMSREATQRTYGALGIADPHHGLSHHAYDPVKLAKLARIDTYHVSLFAYYLEKLSAVEERRPATATGRCSTTCSSCTARACATGQIPQPLEAPDAGGGGRRGPRARRTPHRLRRGHPAHQPAAQPAGEGRRCARPLRRQHRPGGRPVAAAGGWTCGHAPG